MKVGDWMIFSKNWRRRCTVQGILQTLLMAEIRMNAGLFYAPYNGSHQISGDIGFSTNPILPLVYQYSLFYNLLCKLGLIAYYNYDTIIEE